MAVYVLVAGAWHDSWCWSEIVPRLEAFGHSVLTPDLIGMSPGKPTLTEEPLRQWADQIADIVIAQDHPVILVGHSRAGIVISEVAERIPDRIATLVYLAAFLLKDGESVNDVVQRGANTEASANAFIFHDDGTITVSPSRVKSLFYGNARDATVQTARDRLTPEPVASFTTPIHVTEERFGSVPRAYFECTEDQAIPIANQRAMQLDVGVTMTISLRSDHSPFFSQPDELATALDTASRGFEAVS
jgi:pimeloyl-ACP methyl ester carboxylesterase